MYIINEHVCMCEIMRGRMSELLQVVYSYDQIKESEIGGPCSKYGGEERVKVYTGFWWGELKEGNHLDGPGVFVCKTIKTDLQEMGWGGLD